jgi:hypothetical protein
MSKFTSRALVLNYYSNQRPFKLCASFIIVGGYDSDTWADSNALLLFDEETYQWHQMEKASFKDVVQNLL